MLDISDSNFNELKKILRTFVPDCEVWAFGSRVTGKARKYSDLDVVILGKNLLNEIVFSQLREAFSESDLPFKVDVLDWHSINDEFREIIQQQYISI